MLRLSQPQLARRLAVRPTALSNWETGNRDISLSTDLVDDAVKAGGALGGLLWAFGTPDGLDPTRLWSKVFPGPSSPVWLWIRGPGPTIRVEGEWGVFRLEADLDLGPNGAFITLGGSVAESPVVIQLSQPGWADFGRGELPPQVPGATVVSALDLARPSTASGAFMDLFAATMADRFTTTRPREIGGLARRSPLLVSSFFNGYSSVQPRPVRGPWPPIPEASAPDDRQRYALLRQARNLSLVETTERLASETGIRIGKDTLRRFERGRGEPQDRLLPVALDHVLGAGGRLALADIRSGRGSGTVHVPPYWRAPIWLAFDGPTNDGIELTWGAWRRRIGDDLPFLAISHYCEPEPLRLRAGPWTRWTVGVGHRPGAVPVNHGWVPVSIQDAQRVVGETEEAVLDALRHREEQSDGVWTGFGAG